MGIGCQDASPDTKVMPLNAGQDTSTATLSVNQAPPDQFGTGDPTGAVVNAYVRTGMMLSDSPRMFISLCPCTKVTNLTQLLIRYTGPSCHTAFLPFLSYVCS